MDDPYEDALAHFKGLLDCFRRIGERQIKNFRASQYQYGQHLLLPPEAAIVDSFIIDVFEKFELEPGLSASENKYFQAIKSASGRIVTFDTLSAISRSGDSDRASIGAIMSRIRAKSPEAVEHIENVRGLGYRWVDKKG